MKKQFDIKKLVLLNLPYFLVGLFATNFGEAWRLAQGANASEKFLSLFAVLPGALKSFWPSLHPLDLLVGLCCGAGKLVAQLAPPGPAGGPVLRRWPAAGGLSQKQERQEVPAWHGVWQRPMGNP